MQNTTFSCVSVIVCQSCRYVGIQSCVCRHNAILGAPQTLSRSWTEKQFVGFAYCHLRWKYLSLLHLRLTWFVELKNVDSYYIDSIHPPTLSSVETCYLTQVRVQEVLIMLHSHLLFHLLVFIKTFFLLALTHSLNFLSLVCLGFFKQSKTFIPILIVYWKTELNIFSSPP